MGVFSLLTIRSVLLFKAFGVLNKETLMGMSVLSYKIFWKLLAFLSSMTELTENVTCINYCIRKLSATLYVPCLMCIRESYDQ